MSPEFGFQTPAGLFDRSSPGCSSSGVVLFSTPFLRDFMPNTKSAKHRLRQSEQQRLRNRAVKSGLRTVIRKLRESVTAKQFDDAKAIFPRVCKALDQAAAKGVIHVNKASRLKSRLSAYIVRSAA